MKTLKLFALIGSIALLFSSCASILSTNKYDVAIESNVKNAEVEIQNKKGKTVYKGNTPCTVTLKSSQGFFNPAYYTIFAEKDSVLVTDNIKAGIDPLYFGNFLCGGVLGAILIDPATGCMYKIYEDKIYLIIK